MKRPDYRLEQSGAVLKHLPLQILYENARLQTGAVLKHVPLQILSENARLQTGAVPKHFPLQILYEKTFTDWSGSEVLSLTNPP